MVVDHILHYLTTPTHMSHHLYTTAAAGHKLFVLSFSPGPSWKSGLPMKEQGLHADLEHMRQAGANVSVIIAGPYADGSGGNALLFAESERDAMAFVDADPAVVARTMICKVDRMLPVTGIASKESGDGQSIEDIVRRLFDSVPGRDFSAISLYAEDAVVHEAESLPYGGDYTGYEGIRRHAQGYLKHWDGFQQPADRQLDPEFFSAGDQVAVLWRQRGHHGDRRFDMPAVSVYRLAGGKITDSRMFHYDAAAVASFLANDSPAAPSVVEQDALLNSRLEAGGFASALQDFFADDAELAEVDQPPTVGKPASIMREQVFLSALERIEAKLLSSAVQGDVSFAEWKYDIAFKSGRTLSYHQTSRRRWRNGLVVREDYFHADFPPWFAEEMQAAIGKVRGGHIPGRASAVPG